MFIHPSVSGSEIEILKESYPPAEEATAEIFVWQDMESARPLAELLSW